MDKIIANKDFEFNGVDYLVGEVVKVDNYEQVVKLNAIGFIKPLSNKELVLIKREIEKEEVKDEL